jgi:hypothetical protein
VWSAVNQPIRVNVLPATFGADGRKRQTSNPLSARPWRVFFLLRTKARGFGPAFQPYGFSQVYSTGSRSLSGADWHLLPIDRGSDGPISLLS